MKIEVLFSEFTSNKFSLFSFVLSKVRLELNANEGKLAKEKNPFQII